MDPIMTSAFWYVADITSELLPIILPVTILGVVMAFIRFRQ